MSVKQKTLHAAVSIWSNAAFCGAVCIFCIAGMGLLPTAMSAAQTLTPTLGDQVASLRLIVAPGGPTDGVYRAGIEIVMSPGSHTYWKQPGEAGVPPVFAFNGSQNVMSAVVLFPTPIRIGEEGIEAFGYEDKVVFPVVVRPADGTKASILKVDVAYAVCNKICIPAHGTAVLTLAPGGPGVDGAESVSAFATVPTPLPPADRHDVSVARDAGSAKPSWTLTWSGATPIDDIFADAPDGFYFETKKVGPNTFTLVAAQVVGAAKTTQVPVSLTLARKGGGGVVLTETLDVTVATR